MVKRRRRSARHEEAEQQEEHSDQRRKTSEEPTLPPAAAGSAPRAKRIRRKLVIDDAVRLVYERLRSEDSPTKETVANLVQLLKMHKEITDEDETARREVRYSWPGLEESRTDG